jgi:CHAD domain
MGIIPKIQSQTVVCKSRHLTRRQRRRFASLKRYYQKELIKILACLQLKTDTSSTENIHNLRLEIKKVDALFKLTGSVNKEFDRRKHFRPLLRLFKQAGRLRSIQVEFDLMNGYFTSDSNSSYLHQLHEIKHKRRIELRNFIKRGILSELTKSTKEVTPYFKEIKRKEIKRYFKMEERKLNKLLEKKIFKEQELHLVRKNLKRFYLNIKHISPYKMDENLNLLLELLGEWHDRQIAYDQLIKAIYSGQLSKLEADLMREIKMKIRQDKDTLFEKIASAYASRTSSGTSGKPPLRIVEA